MAASAESVLEVIDEIAGELANENVSPAVATTALWPKYSWFTLKSATPLFNKLVLDCSERKCFGMAVLATEFNEKTSLTCTCYGCFGG